MKKHIDLLKQVMLLGVILLTVSVIQAQDFKAYYTKLNSGADWEATYRMGKHADLVVQFSSTEKFYFWKASSYLPRWETTTAANYISQAPITFSGDGTGLRWDLMCRHSHIRLISSDANEAKIHWRYAPKFMDGKTLMIPKWTGWIDEYYTVRSNKTVSREVYVYDTKTKHTYEYTLNTDGTITENSKSNTSFSKTAPAHNSLKLPSGPDLSFGAVYTKLGYSGPYFQNDAPSPQWNDNWQMGDYADIVVNFDNSPKKWVFWRGAAYVPHMVTDNNIWYTNEFNEAWNLNWDGGKSCEGAYAGEPMNDKPSIYGHARVIENSPARIVVHYRYGLSNTCNELGKTDEDKDYWRVFSDFYYYIYPDGITAQYNTIWSVRASEDPSSFEWQETILTNQPGTGPYDNLKVATSMTYGNLSGQYASVDWSKLTQPEENINSGITNPSISRMDIKGTTLDPFVIVEYGSEIKYTSAVPIGQNIHWPVSIHHSFGEPALNNIFPSHTPTSNVYDWPSYELGSNYASKVMLTGMETLTNDELTLLAKSWDTPATLSTVTGATFNKYDKAQRAYLLTASADNISFTIDGSTDKPIHSPGIVIKGWNSKNEATLKINGKQQTNLTDFKQGVFVDTDGTETLVIWIDKKSTSELNIEISKTTSNTCEDVTPAKPSGIVASVDNCNATIAWSASNCAVNYRLQRSINNGDWETLSETLTSTSYVDNSINPNATYAYRVRAQNSNLNSEDIVSNTVSCSDACNWSPISFDSFEHTMGTWSTGDVDIEPSEDAKFAKTGGQSVAISGNADASKIATKAIDLSGVKELRVSFAYLPKGMAKTDDDFMLNISTDGGTTYTKSKDWNFNDEFVNDKWYSEVVTITGPFTASTKLQFLCNAGTNQNIIYLDDVIVEACFGKAAPAQYLLSVTAENGTVSPASGNFNKGTKVTLTATPKEGYKFDSWSGDITGTTNPIEITMDGNKSIVANFKSTKVTSVDNASNLGIKVYPNPASSTVQIQIQGNDFVVSMYNVSGQKVLTGKGLKTIDVSELQKGTYYIEIKKAEFMEVRKLQIN